MGRARSEGWMRRRGRVQEGWLDEHAAIVAMTAAIADHGRAAETPRVSRRTTFADAAALWLHHLEHVKGAKPSTLDDYR